MRILDPNNYIYPDGYFDLDPETREELVNGCGTAGWKGHIVPDTIWGMDATPICNIHDIAYFLGETQQDKDKADRAFLLNLIRLAENSTRSAVLLYARVLRCATYYLAVKKAGDSAFWADKDTNSKEVAPKFDVDGLKRLLEGASNMDPSTLG